MRCDKCDEETSRANAEVLCVHCSAERRRVLYTDRARIAAAIREVITKSDWPERPHHLLPRLLRVVEGG